MSNPTVVKSPEIWHRDDFVLLCMWRRYNRIIEIGIDRAEFAQRFMQRWWNESVYLGIDPYYSYTDVPGDRDADFQIAVRRFEPFANFARLIRLPSVAAANFLSSCGCPHLGCGRKYHFIYIDACHDHDSVTTDINTWWPFVSEDGILAGHDYDEKDHPGVVSAVNAFAAAHGLTVYVTYERHAPSWYVYKRGMPTSPRIHPGEKF